MNFMKPLKILVRESIFDDVEDIANNDTALIEQFLKDNYKIDGTYTIKDNIVDVEGDVKVKNKRIESLTNGIFRFGTVSQVFCCDECLNLVSLEGAPKEVGESFYCYFCKNLKSLEGAPEKLPGEFHCYECSNLTSLKGSPKKVGLSFDCSDCSNLKSLEGAPKEVGEDFNCGVCPKLTSLEGAPDKIGGDLICNGCGSIKITNQDRKKYKIKS